MYLYIYIYIHIQGMYLYCWDGVMEVDGRTRQRSSTSVSSCTVSNFPITSYSTSMLQCVAVLAVCDSVWQCVAVCCSVLQCVAVCYSVLQRVAVCCSVLQCLAMSGSVSQCVALCCTVLHCVALRHPITSHPPTKMCQQLFSGSRRRSKSESDNVLLISLQSVAVCCTLLHSVALCCTVFVAVEG